MAVTYGFYNSIDHDRVYNAAHMSSIFNGIINDGVFMSIGTAFQVTPGAGLTVNVGIGRAWFNSTWTDNDSPLTIPIDIPDLVFGRIDVIVLEVNAQDAVRANSIKVIKGTPASSPTIPALTNTSTIHQYPLAYLSVPVGATTFTAANITNKIGSSLCPYITGILSTINTDSILAQWEQEFNVWFDEMKDQLSTDAAGNLQIQISNKIAARQGTDPVSWGDGMGTPQNYFPPFNTKIQVGVAYIHGSGPGEVDVVYPQAFSSFPIVFLTPSREGLSNIPATAMVLLNNVTGFKARVTLHSTNAPYHSDGSLTLVHWLAIGPA